MDAPSRKADQVAASLLRSIARGEIQTGTTLPVEAKLADSFSVNRSVIREAVKLLEVHRLVQPVRRRGTVVLDPLESLSPEVLQALLSPRPGEIDLGMLSSLLEVRAAIDVEMNGLAAERRTEEDMEAIRSSASLVMASKEDARRFARLLDDFALAVARATHSPLFVMLAHWHRRVYGELEDVFETVRLPSSPWVEGLSVLITRFEEKDGPGARMLARAYHDWAGPRLMATAALRNGAPLSEIRGTNDGNATAL